MRLPHFAPAAVLIVSLVGCGKKSEGDSAEAAPDDGAAMKAKLKTDIASTARPNGTLFKGPGANDKGKAPEAPIEPEKWAALNEWSQAGDVRVRVTKAKVQHVPLLRLDGSSYKSREPELMLWVEVENLSKTKKVLYGRWDGSAFQTVNKLTDEHGNKYRFSPYDGYSLGRVDGSIKGSTRDMRPGDAAFTDILCLERPVEAATELKLVLRAIQTETKDTHRFVIPADAWK